MAFVLDSSVALAWVLPDEQNAEVDAIASRLENETAIVPVIWPLEVHNALLTAERRSRISDSQVNTALGALSALAIEIDQDTDMISADRALQIARESGLSVYDASYLELAVRRGIPLASIDQRLREACRSAQVSLLP